MATWGLHLRIAEELLNKEYLLDETSFLVGNIGPDCGVPNEDWSKFDPPGEVSHWKNADGDIDTEKFYSTYLDKNIEDEKEKSFLLGYYVHLLTDIEFSKFLKNKKNTDRNYKPLLNDRKFIWTIKKDWYDLDHLYFRENPTGLFYKTFQHVKDFPDYMSYYPKGAVTRQVKYITEFYKNPPENLDREYIYLTMKEMDEFVADTVNAVEEELELKYFSNEGLDDAQ